MKVCTYQSLGGEAGAGGRVKFLALNEFNCFKRKMENKFVQLCKPKKTEREARAKFNTKTKTIDIIK